MTTIAAKQKSLGMGELTPQGTFASPTDWMASFLDFQISKLESQPATIRTRIDPTFIKMRWN